MFSFFANSDSENEEQLASNEEVQSDSEEKDESEPKSMKDYYNDLEAVIAKIRKEVKNADKDPSFHHAATVLTEVINLCRNIESSYNPATVYTTNKKRSELLKTLGPDGLIEIKGEASKLLVIHYRELMIALANKEYWPKAPIFYKPAVNFKYASELESHAEQTQQRIQEYQKRIDEYEKSKANVQPVEVKRRRR